MQTRKVQTNAVPMYNRAGQPIQQIAASETGSEENSYSYGPSTPPSSCGSEKGEPVMAGSWCPRYSQTGRSGEIVVVTPWYPFGVEKGLLKLGPEIQDFCNFLRPSPAEKMTRNRVRCTLQEICQRIWSDSTVKEFGGAAYGATIPSSAIDMVCEASQFNEGFPEFLEAVQARNFTVIHEEPTSVVLSTLNLTVNLHFELTDFATKRNDVHVVKRFLQQFPHAVDICKVVKQVLAQMKYNDVSIGGLSSYSILLMSITACRLCPYPYDVGACLKFFFQLYSTFDFRNQTITPFPEAPIIPREPSHGDVQVSVMSPDGSCENVAALCNERIIQIKAHFQYLSMALGKWDGQLTVPSGQKKGYKGRTPLSLIIPLQPLWIRAETLVGSDIVRQFQ